ncbi:hypothetical protein LX36DRAFT_654461 [Colletotrichum falcatum]|nr:hypothetical protein LX36DRAFT_654461 [Colletotrichum falcatum]
MDYQRRMPKRTRISQVGQKTAAHFVILVQRGAPSHCQDYRTQPSPQMCLQTSSPNEGPSSLPPPHSVRLGVRRVPGEGTRESAEMPAREEISVVHQRDDSSNPYAGTHIASKYFVQPDPQTAGGGARRCHPALTARLNGRLSTSRQPCKISAWARKQAPVAQRQPSKKR